MNLHEFMWGSDVEITSNENNVQTTGLDACERRSCKVSVVECSY